MREAFRLISTRFNEDIARLVCIENPARVVKGQDLLTVRPPKRREVDG